MQFFFYPRVNYYTVSPNIFLITLQTPHLSQLPYFGFIFPAFHIPSLVLFCLYPDYYISARMHAFFCPDEQISNLEVKQCNTARSGLQYRGRNTVSA